MRHWAFTNIPGHFCGEQIVHANQAQHRPCNTIQLVAINVFANAPRMTSTWLTGPSDRLQILPVENAAKLRQTLARNSPGNYAKHGNVPSGAKECQREMLQSIFRSQPQIVQIFRLGVVQSCQMWPTCVVYARSPVLYKGKYLWLVKVDHVIDGMVPAGSHESRDLPTALSNDFMHCRCHGQTTIKQDI